MDRPLSVLCSLVVLLCIVTCRPLHYTPTPDVTPEEFRKYMVMDAYDDGDEPLEVEASICSIVTDKITATANATISRQLKGVCKAREVREQLRRMELSIHRELKRVLTLLQTNRQNIGRERVVFKYLPNGPTN